MNKFMLAVGALTIAIIIGGAVFFSRNEQGEEGAVLALPSNYEYFWGEGCLHCAKVDEFLESWEHTDKLQLDKKEIYSNRLSSNLLSERGKSCGIPANQIGVPLVFTPKGECITGDEPVINFFKSLDFKE